MDPAQDPLTAAELILLPSAKDCLLPKGACAQCIAGLFRLNTNESLALAVRILEIHGTRSWTLWKSAWEALDDQKESSFIRQVYELFCAARATGWSLSDEIDPHEVWLPIVVALRKIKHEALSDIFDHLWTLSETTEIGKQLRQYLLCDKLERASAQADIGLFNGVWSRFNEIYRTGLFADDEMAICAVRASLVSGYFKLSLSAKNSEVMDLVKSCFSTFEEIPELLMNPFLNMLSSIAETKKLPTFEQAQALVQSVKRLGNASRFSLIKLLLRYENDTATRLAATQLLDCLATREPLDKALSTEVCSRLQAADALKYNQILHSERAKEFMPAQERDQRLADTTAKRFELACTNAKPQVIESNIQWALQHLTTYRSLLRHKELQKQLVQLLVAGEAPEDNLRQFFAVMQECDPLCLSLFSQTWEVQKNSRFDLAMEVAAILLKYGSQSYTKNLMHWGIVHRFLTRLRTNHWHNRSRYIHPRLFL